MAKISSVMKEISGYINMDKEALFQKGVQSLLKEKKRALLLERLKILDRYKVSSKKDFEKKLEKGEIAEHPGWEDIIVLENLEEEQKKIDEYIQSI